MGTGEIRHIAARRPSNIEKVPSKKKVFDSKDNFPGTLDIVNKF